MGHPDHPWCGCLSATPRRFRKVLSSTGERERPVPCYRSGMHRGPQGRGTSGGFGGTAGDIYGELISRADAKRESSGPCLALIGSTAFSNRYPQVASAPRMWRPWTPRDPPTGCSWPQASPGVSQPWPLLGRFSQMHSSAFLALCE